MLFDEHLECIRINSSLISTNLPDPSIQHLSQYVQTEVVAKLCTLHRL
ncbi:hypothetical protein CURTO8I2_130080 [Curtobacterium sp. 8I-2]|nr:hypothetical protein CURTO8I2_130080 [Curtobacterium sp. 8I-2]